jgi:hypothetical protein
MTEIERLSIEQLSELEELLEKQMAPIVSRFRPPASPASFGAIEELIGCPLPDELRQWWAWHDGTNAAPGELAVSSSIGPFFIFRSADEGLAITRECRKEAEEVSPDDPGARWGSTWIAVGSHGQVACECAVESDAPVPVLDVDYHKAAYPGAVVTRSLGEMVRWWIEALESGAWRYDNEHNRWERVFELISPERDRTGLV